MTSLRNVRVAGVRGYRSFPDLFFFLQRQEDVMPVVHCPKCQSDYDPGNEDLADMPAGMSIKVVCPACGQWLRLPENELIPAPAAPPEMLREMMQQSRLIRKGDGSHADAGVPVAKPWWKFW